MRSYYSFAFVRHPFDRAVSFHAHLQRDDEWRRELAPFYGLAEATDFDDYCRWLNTSYGSDAFADQHFRSQHLSIRAGGDRLPDFVGRFENIEADIDRVAAHVAMPRPTLLLLNTAAGWTTTPEAWRAARAKLDARLNERNKALLQQRYAEDFKLFRYAP